jgi:enoyl-CoA hydratase/carnithine racemase
MLLALYPTRTVEQLVLEGEGLGGERALELGLVERLAAAEEVLGEALRLARQLASRPQRGYQVAKGYLRGHLFQLMAARDQEELETFLDCWFDPATQDRMAALVAEMSR